MFAGLNVPDGPPDRIAVFYDLLPSRDGPDGEFVPKLMDEDEIRAIIKEVLAELQIDQPTVKDKGRIMKTLMPRVSSCT